MTLTALDLYCGAGGASAGLVLADFYVVGVDKVRQPRYPYEFVLSDALSLPLRYLRQFDFIWASPPCQPYSKLASLGHHWCTDELIAPTRAILKAAGVPFVIENVPGAPLVAPFTLCGAMFGLRTYRHRIFETGFLPRIAVPPHPRHAVSSQLCTANRYDPNLFVSVYGKCGNADLARSTLQVPWMSGKEASQCVPPAYSQYIGEQVRAYLGV